jgi:hypothetical protein
VLPTDTMLDKSLVQRRRGNEGDQQGRPH